MGNIYVYQDAITIDADTIEGAFLNVCNGYMQTISDAVFMRGALGVCYVETFQVLDRANR